MGQIASWCRHLGHPLRLRLLGMLRDERDICVCSLAAELGVDQPTLSRHLRILRDAGIVDCRREGARVIYFVPRRDASRFLARLEALFAEDLEKEER
jgi:ArsR family transcriptional regulator